MIIHHLKVAGFRIMGDVTEIKFPEEGRIGILGPNESGKTTLFQAIEFVLYGLKKGSGVESDRQNLVTWGKNEAKLEIEFTSGSHRYNLQRVFNTKLLHKAILTPVINGQKERADAVTNLKEVENRIEQITGMDRDSFCKLVYIKQKDLDALKELAKSKREQLVNKVMGIELFDDAASNVKTDSSNLEDELEKTEIQLKEVKKNKEDYELKSLQKALLLSEISEKQTILNDKNKEIENSKAVLLKYDWLLNHKSASETKASLLGQLNQVKKDLESIKKLEEDAKNLKVSIVKYKPEIRQLQSLRDKLSQIENSLTQAQNSLESLQIQEDNLSKEILEQQKTLAEKQIKLDDANQAVEKHEWLFSYNSAKQVEASLEKQLEQVNKEIENFNKLEADSKKYTSIIQEYRPEIDGLQVLYSKLLDLERQVAQSAEKVATLQTQKQAAIEKTGFSRKELSLLSKDIPKEKSAQLTKFGISLLGSAGCFVGGFFLGLIIISGIGAALVALGGYFFSRYLKIDRLMMRSIEIESFNKQSTQEKTNFDELNGRKAQATAESPFGSSESVQNRFEAISKILQHETDESSIKGIEALLRNTNANLSNLRNANLPRKQQVLNSQIEPKRIEINKLQSNKPASLINVDYSQKEHDSAKSKLRTIKSEFDAAKQNVDSIEGTILSVSKQIKTLTEQIGQFQANQKEATEKTGIKKSQDANLQLEVLSKALEQETGENSIEGAEALLKNTKEQSTKLNLSNPQAAQQRLEKQVTTKQIEIEALEQNKPENVAELDYTKDEHETAKTLVETLQSRYLDLNHEVGNKKGTLQQIIKDLNCLQPDFDAFPAIKIKAESTAFEISLLKRVNFEISETSKDMRNKVLPSARFIINNILPTLTSDRYSDFEITEDLKFKVHSNEAGGYKEREIFSGGTQDQFLIALRLAFTQSILDSRVMADKYSLLMDECTASSDEIRKQGIFEVLSAMKQTFSQIFIIAHEDIVTFVDHHIVFDRNERGYTQVKSTSWES